MPRYTFQAGAHWPNSLIDLTNYRDADNTVGPLIAQIKQYQESGDYDAAQQLIILNIDTLKKYTLDASYINKYVEELRNLEIYTKSKKQQIFYEPTEDEAATYADLQDVWLGNIGDGSSVISYGDALDSQVLEGATFIGSDGVLHTGTMTDYGAVDVDLLPGETYTIPAGYHNGNGIITAIGSTPSSGGKVNLGTHTFNGLKEGFDVTNATQAFFRVEVPTVMTGTVELTNGTTTLTLPNPIQNFVYITGYKLKGSVGYSAWFKTVDGKWVSKGSDTGDGYGIKSVEGSNVTIKWKNTVTFDYCAF